MDLQLILIAFFASFGVPHNVQSNNGQIRNNIQENLHDLFDSLNKNDPKKSETYRNILRQEAGREQHAFDSMKEELRVARQRNANLKQEDFYSRVRSIYEKAAISKRQTGNNDSQNAFTEEEERNVIKELDTMVHKIPVPQRHISEPKQYCVNRCLQDAVKKKYEPNMAVNVTSIPLAKQPLYRKLASSISECVVKCELIAGYDKFLMKLAEIVLHPDSLILNLARSDEMLANNMTKSKIAG